MGILALISVDLFHGGKYFKILVMTVMGTKEKLEMITIDFSEFLLNTLNHFNHFITFTT